MLKSFKLWILTLGLASLGLANDSPFLGSGSLQPINGEHPHVRMESEDVYLKVYLGSYDVDARFVFTNDGPAQDVTMGFPEWGHDYLSDQPNFSNFQSSVDGVPVGVKRFVPAGQDRQNFKAWWLKTVHFGPYQTRLVTVRFSARLDSTPDGDTYHAVAYDFTGQAWKGKIQESRLTVRLPYHGASLGGFARGSEGYRGPGMTRDGRWVYFVRRNWEARQHFQLVFRDPPGFPKTQPPISEAFLKGKSAWELTIMRNQIAARHGRAFSDPDLRRHFEAQSWYSVDPNYSDRRLRSFEIENMQTIQKYQNQHHLN